MFTDVFIWFSLSGLKYLIIISFMTSDSNNLFVVAYMALRISVHGASHLGFFTRPESTDYCIPHDSDSISFFVVV